jgi:hypothetical protein
MTGYPELNYPAFHEAEEQLQELGHETFNPAPNKPENPTWVNFMRMSLVQISQVDAIALLPGWEESKGACLEVNIARELGFDIRPLDKWLMLDETKIIDPDYHPH